MSGPSLSALRGLPGPDKQHRRLHPTLVHRPKRHISHHAWAFTLPDLWNDLRQDSQGCVQPMLLSAELTCRLTLA